MPASITSAELQATYRFAVKDGKLTLAMNWQEPAVLEPTVLDEFQGPFGTAIVFRRDAAGHITGCDLFAGASETLLLPGPWRRQRNNQGRLFSPKRRTE